MIFIDEPGLAENHEPGRFRPDRAFKRGRILAHAFGLAPSCGRVRNALIPSEGCVERVTWACVLRRPLAEWRRAAGGAPTHRGRGREHRCGGVGGYPTPHTI